MGTFVIGHFCPTGDSFIRKTVLFVFWGRLLLDIFVLLGTVLRIRCFGVFGKWIQLRCFSFFVFDISFFGGGTGREFVIFFLFGGSTERKNLLLLKK